MDIAEGVEINWQPLKYNYEKINENTHIGGVSSFDL